MKQEPLSERKYQFNGIECEEDEFLKKLTEDCSEDAKSAINTIIQLLGKRKNTINQLNIEDGSININIRNVAPFYKELADNRKEISKFHLEKLLRLKPEYQTEKEKKELEGWHRDDSYARNHSSWHIMYKLGKPLLSNDGKRAYEFLIEYNVNKPNEGIYYGCKVTLFPSEKDKPSEKDIEDQLTKIKNEWSSENSRTAVAEEEVASTKELIISYLDAVFPGKNFRERLLHTDNVNDNTYWSFWIRVQENEDIVWEIAHAVRIIRNVYKSNLDLNESGSNILEYQGIVNEDDDKLLEFEKEKQSEDEKNNRISAIKEDSSKSEDRIKEEQEKVKNEKSFLSLSSLASISFTDSWRNLLKEKLGKDNFNALKGLIDKLSNRIFIEKNKQYIKVEDAYSATDTKEDGPIGTYSVTDTKEHEYPIIGSLHLAIQIFWDRRDKKQCKCKSIEHLITLLSKTVFVKKEKNTNKISSFSISAFKKGCSKSKKKKTELESEIKEYLIAFYKKLSSDVQKN